MSERQGGRRLRLVDEFVRLAGGTVAGAVGCPAGLGPLCETLFFWRFRLTFEGDSRLLEAKDVGEPASLCAMDLAVSFR